MAKHTDQPLTTRAERRRLQRILDDIEYGPKLVRLSPDDQRTVLDLISANKGAEARKTILELDEKRREKQRSKRPPSMKSLREKALKNFEDIVTKYKVRYNLTHVEENVLARMNKEELIFAATMDVDELTFTAGSGNRNFFYH